MSEGATTWLATGFVQTGRYLPQTWIAAVIDNRTNAVTPLDLNPYNQAQLQLEPTGRWHSRCHAHHSLLLPIHQLLVRASTMSWLVKLGLSLWSWLIHQRLTPRFGWLLPLLFPLKIVATALTPLLALLGLLATWRGVAPYSAQRRDLWLMLAGLVSFITGGRYIWQTSAPHTQFETVFGADWWNRVPPALQSRFQTWRWPALGGSNRPVSHTPNITLAPSTATGQPLLADLWQPAGLLPTRLAIVYLHGSGWHFLDKDMDTRPLFRYPRWTRPHHPRPRLHPRPFSRRQWHGRRSRPSGAMADRPCG